jgi:hypothetical protein
VRLCAFIAAWLILSGFTMRVEWTMPDDSNHEYFVMEYCRTSTNAKNCLRSANGWKETLEIAGDLREAMVTQDELGQHCYRIKAVNAAGRSGPSDVKCGFN